MRGTCNGEQRGERFFKTSQLSANSSASGSTVYLAAGILCRNWQLHHHHRQLIGMPNWRDPANFGEVGRGL